MIFHKISNKKTILRAIGIVVAVICGVIIVIIIVVSLCSRYCCNCCDNLCFQGRGQNRKGEKKILKSDVTSPETPIYPIFNGTIDPSRGKIISLEYPKHFLY